MKITRRQWIIGGAVAFGLSWLYLLVGVTSLLLGPRRWPYPQATRYDSRQMHDLRAEYARRELRRLGGTDSGESVSRSAARPSLVDKLEAGGAVPTLGERLAAPKRPAWYTKPPDDKRLNAEQAVSGLARRASKDKDNSTPALAERLVVAPKPKRSVSAPSHTPPPARITRCTDPRLRNQWLDQLIINEDINSIIDTCDRARAVLHLLPGARSTDARLLAYHNGYDAACRTGHSVSVTASTRDKILYVRRYARRISLTRGREQALGRLSAADALLVDGDSSVLRHLLAFANVQEARFMVEVDFAGWPQDLDTYLHFITRTRQTIASKVAVLDPP